MEVEQKVPSDLQQEGQIFLSIWGSAGSRAVSLRAHSTRSRLRPWGHSLPGKLDSRTTSTAVVPAAAPQTPALLMAFPRNNSPKHWSQCHPRSYTHLGAATAVQHLQLWADVQQFPFGVLALQCTWNSIPGLCLGVRAAQSSCVHQVMRSSHITHANKTLNHNCSDPGHCCTLPLGDEIQLITYRACCRYMPSQKQLYFLVRSSSFKGNIQFIIPLWSLFMQKKTINSLKN